MLCENAKLILKTACIIRPEYCHQQTIFALKDGTKLTGKHCRRHFHSFRKSQHEWSILENITRRDIKKVDKKFACFLLNISDESFAHFDRHRYVWDEATLKVAVDGSANCLAKRKIIHTADVVCGDFDSIDPKLLEQLRCPTKKSELPMPQSQRAAQTATMPQVIETPSQKETDFTKAIRVAMSKRRDIDYFFGMYHSDGTRIDHLFSLVNTLHLIKKHIFLWNVQSNTISWLLPPGSHLIKKHPGRDLCSLVPFTGSTTVKTEGLEYDVHSSHLFFGGLISTSNICSQTSEFVKVDTDRELLWSADVSVPKT